MSAIDTVCSRCGSHYMVGMVGSTPWPAHNCLPLTADGMCDDVAILNEPFVELSCELPEGHDGDHKGFLMTQGKSRAFLHWQTVE